nr:tRNA pseudouridine(13) synthase TruD [Zophobihabitans entericus]
MNELAYLYGTPQVTGDYKQNFEDFIVREDLGFEPDGAGEHVMVYLRKRDCNTTFVAEHLAKFAGIHPKNVSYAGLKDRHGVTEQWFGLHMPGKETPDFSQFTLEGCEVLTVTRQSKKLRTGVLKGNYFILVLRNVSNKEELEARLQQIQQSGVPNYFGEQRFGRDNSNINNALLWAKGEIKVKDRNKRSFYLSAARSAIFNDMVSERIIRQLDKKVLTGDAIQLAGRGSWFVVKADEVEQVQTRLEANELRITAPMVGDNALGSQLDALSFEESCLIEKWQPLLSLFKQERVETARRAILLQPEQLAWKWLDAQTIELNFWLNAGSYATSVLRELMQQK